MDDCITRAEHEEFARRFEAEEKRQNHRLDLLEESTRQINNLTISVEKMAYSIESMVQEQKEQGERLEKLEKVPGEKWGHLIQTLIGVLASGLVGYAIGMIMH